MDKLFINILNMSVSASYLILAVIAVRFLLRKAPKNMRCFLWFLVGIRLLFPFSAESVFSLIPSTQVVDESIYYTSQPVVNSGIPVVDASINQYLQENYTLNSANSMNKTQIAGYICAGIWIIGMALMLGYMIISWLCLSHRVKTAVPMDLAIDEEHQIRIYQSDAIETPFLFGIIRPRIYIPYDLAQEELPYVILHEKAHMKRKDYLIKPVGFLFLMVYWFNPCIWIAYILLCKDIELICDEEVVRELGMDCKKAYSQALLSCAVNRRMITACPIAFGEVGVKERVKNILNYKKPALWIFIAAVLACIIVPICFMTQKKGAEGVGEIAEKDNDIVQTEEVLEKANTLFGEITVQQLYDGTEITVEEIKERQMQLENLEKELLAEKEQLQKQSDETEDLMETLKELEASIAQAEAEKALLSELLEGVDGNLSVKEYIEQWAQAFCNRDGKTIVSMADENAEQIFIDRALLTEGISGEADYAAFGWSSPWPWGIDNYEDTTQCNYCIVSITEYSAEILYYAWVSDPHVTVWRELLTYKIENDKCVITSETLDYMEYMCVAKEFYQAYPEGVISGTMMDYYSYNGAGEALNENAKANKSMSTYAALFEPDTAAVYLLNILDNPNKVGTAVKFDGDSNTCEVTFTFYEDGSTASVTMIQPYGQDGIWLPWSGGEMYQNTSTSSISYMITSQNVEAIMKADAARLEELFPNHHEMTISEFPKYVDLNGDGIEELIEVVNLGYNGGDGGVSVSVTDAERFPPRNTGRCGKCV